MNRAILLTNLIPLPTRRTRETGSWVNLEGMIIGAASGHDLLF